MKNAMFSSRCPTVFKNCNCNCNPLITLPALNALFILFFKLNMIGNYSCGGGGGGGLSLALLLRDSSLIEFILSILIFL